MVLKIGLTLRFGWSICGNSSLLVLPDAQERLTLLTQVHQQATRLDLSPELVLSIIEVESGFDRYAVSRAGAQGLMQVMPF